MLDRAALKKSAFRNLALAGVWLVLMACLMVSVDRAVVMLVLTAVLFCVTASVGGTCLIILCFSRDHQTAPSASQPNAGS